MARRIAVIGSNMMDLITYAMRMPVPGETLEAPSLEMGHDGKGANQAVAAARLGANVIMVGKVGEDVFGEATIRNFATAGIDTRYITVARADRAGSRPSWSIRRARTRS